MLQTSPKESKNDKAKTSLKVGLGGVSRGARARASWNMLEPECPGGKSSIGVCEKVPEVVG